MTDLNPFCLLTSKLEIARLLLLAQDRNVPLLMRIPGRPISGLTTVLAVDGQDDTLYLDAAQDEDLNRRLIDGGRVRFETLIDRVKLSFETHGVQRVRYEGYPALLSPLPTTAWYEQRRDDFRADAPAQPPLSCELWPEHDGGSPPISALVRDISGTGLALSDPELQLATVPGTRYRCRLGLPGVGPLSLALRVVHCHDDALAKGGVARRIGCQFEQLQGITRIRIQAYVNSLQREHTARWRGLS